MRASGQWSIAPRRGCGGEWGVAVPGAHEMVQPQQRRVAAPRASKNKKGAPKGWGLKRIAGGLADAITMGTTDFDKRGAGIGQFGGFTGRRMQRPSRTRSHSSFVDKYMKIAGERYIPGQPLTERQYQVATMGMQMGNTYNDDVLRSYAMYEEQNVSSEPEVIIINKNNTVPVRVGGEQEMMVVGGSDSGSSDESYASYQGH